MSLIAIDLKNDMESDIKTVVFDWQMDIYRNY